jgi:hypothetical protein
MQRNNAATAKLPIYLCAEIFRSQKAIPQETEDVIRLSQIIRYIGRASYRVSELSGKTGEWISMGPAKYHGIS